MEKKNYLQPLCLVVALQQQSALMQSSENQQNQPYLNVEEENVTGGLG